MLEALKEAEKARKLDEVPIGAIIVKNGEIISRGHNMREKCQNAIKHAEIIAIDKACKKLKSWRLNDCEIYVTLEPCPMCMGAIINSRMKKVIYGATDTEGGCCGGRYDIRVCCSHTVEVEGGVFENDCRKILQDYFALKRKIKKGEKNADNSRSW